MRRMLVVMLGLMALFVLSDVRTPLPTYDSASHHFGFVQPVEAQIGDFRGFQKTFTAQTAVGATATSGLMRGIPIAHTAELVVTGAPTGCTYRLQGSRDGVTWFNISAADITCTSSTVAFENGKPAVSVRGNLLTLTGGTTPSVTLKYIGK